MDKTIIIKILTDNFVEGLTAIFQVVDNRLEDRINSSMQFICKLDTESCKQIREEYRQWQRAYYSQITSSRKPNIIVNQLGDDLKNIKKTRDGLVHKLNSCLNNSELAVIKEQIKQSLNICKSEKLRFQDDYTQVIIETDNFQARQIPWHLWDFLKDINAEITFSSLNYKLAGVSHTTLKDIYKINILAILGDDSNINIQNDGDFLETFKKNNGSNIYIEILSSPTPKIIIEKLEKSLKCWDILYFAGHSESKWDSENGLNGLMYINSQDILKIDDLKAALNKAIPRGLKLAIFNSCDGLGLAHDLEELNIPQIIVMREAVPDYIAQKFLHCFFTDFSKGYSLCTSVENARKELEKLEDIFPCASWLPVICKNPVTEFLTWETLLDSKSKPVFSKTHPKKNVLLLIILGVSIFMSTSIHKDVRNGNDSSLKSQETQHQQQANQDLLISSNRSKYEYTYTCEVNQGVPTIFIQTVAGKREFIQFRTDFGNNVSYTPVRRCQEITTRLDLLGKYEAQYITNGKINNQPVICITNKAGGGCISLLLTIKPGEDSKSVLRDILEINRSNFSNQPLIE